MDKKAFVWGDPRPEGPSGIQDTPPPGHTSPYEFDFPYGGQSPERVDNTSPDKDLKTLWDKKPAGGDMIDDLQELINKMLGKKNIDEKGGGEAMPLTNESLRNMILQRMAAEFPNIQPSGKTEVAKFSKDDIENVVKILTFIKEVVSERYTSGYLRGEGVDFEKSGARVTLVNLANQPELYQEKSLLEKLTPLLSQTGSPKMTGRAAYDRYHDVTVKAIKDSPAEDKEGPLPIIVQAIKLASSWMPGAAPEGKKKGKDTAEVSYDPEFSSAFAKEMEAVNALGKAIHVGEKTKEAFAMPYAAMRGAGVAMKQTLPQVMAIEHDLTVASHPMFRAVIDKLASSSVGSSLMASTFGLNDNWKKILAHTIVSFAYNSEERSSVTMSTTKDMAGKERGRVTLTPVQVPDKNIKPIKMSVEELNEWHQKLKEETGLDNVTPDDLNILARLYSRTINDAMARNSEAAAKKTALGARITAVASAESEIQRATKMGRQKISEIVKLPEASEETEQMLNKVKMTGETLGDFRAITDGIKRFLSDPSLAHMESKPTKDLPQGAYSKPTSSSLFRPFERESGLGDLSQFVDQAEILMLKYQQAVSELEEDIFDYAQKLNGDVSKLLSESKEIESTLVSIEGKKSEETAPAEEEKAPWYERTMDWVSEQMTPSPELAMGGATASVAHGITVKAADAVDEEKEKQKSEREKYRPEVKHVSRESIASLKQFISNCLANYNVPVTKLVPDWVKKAELRGSQIMETVFKAGAGVLQRLISDHNVYVAKYMSLLGEAIGSGKLKMGTPHEKYMDEFTEDIASDKIVKAKAVQSSLAELEKEFAQAANLTRSNFGIPEMTDFLTPGGKTTIRVSPVHPLAGLEPEDMEDPEAYKKLDIEAVAAGLYAVLNKKSTQGDKATMRAYERLYVYLTTIADRARMDKAEALRKKYEGKDIPAEEAAEIQGLEGKPYRIDVKMADKPEISMEKVPELLSMLEEMKADLDEASNRGITEMSREEEVELQGLMDKAEKLKISGQNLSPQEDERMHVLNEKLKYSRAYQSAMTPAQKEYFHYKLSPEQAAKGAGNLEVMINAMRELNTLKDQVKEYDEAVAAGRTPTGPLARSYEEFKSKLDQIREAFREMEKTPAFQNQINLVEVKANPIFKALYEKYYKIHSGGEEVDWSKAVPVKEKPGKKTSSLAGVDSLFRNGPILVSAAESDPEFDAAVKGAMEIITDMRKELAEIVSTVGSLKVASGGLAGAQAAQRGSLERKADRIAGADMYKEYDQSNNALTLIEGVDGVKKLTINKKIRDAVKERLNPAQASRYANGENVCVDLEDRIAKGTIVSSLDGGEYAVSIDGNQVRVSEVNLFRI